MTWSLPIAADLEALKECQIWLLFASVALQISLAIVEGLQVTTNLSEKRILWAVTV